MPTTARVRLKHEFAHPRVFSKRASGAGVGAINPLSPQMKPTGPANMGTVSEIEEMRGVIEDGGEAQLQIRAPGQHGVRKPRKRKRKELEGLEAALVEASGGPVQSSTPLNISPSTPFPPSETYSAADRGDSSNVVGTGKGSNSQFFHRLMHIDHAELRATNSHASVGSVTPWSPSTSAVSQHAHPAILPHNTDIHLQARVLFPAEYILELRRNVNSVFAEAERPGGMSIDEAQSFEMAFAPLLQLAHELEERQQGNIHPVLRGGNIN